MSAFQEALEAEMREAEKALRESMQAEVQRLLYRDPSKEWAGLSAVVGATPITEKTIKSAIEKIEYEPYRLQTVPLPPVWNVVGARGAPPCGLIRNEADYKALVEYIEHSPHWVPFAVDTETTGLRVFDRTDVLRGISVADANHQWYVSVSHPDSWCTPIGDLLDALTEHPLVFHHAVFDWGVLRRKDVRTMTDWDTQVGNWLMDENLKSGLKESADRILGADSSAEKKALRALTKETGRSWSTFTAEDIAEYAAEDARLTYDLYRWQLDHVATDEDFFKAMEREMDVQRCVYELNAVGVGVDMNHLTEAIAEAEQLVAEMEESFSKYGVNPRSPKQLGKWLYDDLGYECQVFTKTGARSTGVAALKELADRGSEEAAALLAQRKVQKELTAYYRPLMERVVDVIDGVGTVYPFFSSTRTVTGRLSCREPNLMTIPREDVMSDVRACFKPRPGYSMWEFDLNQAELRVIAGYSQDPEMMGAILDPERNLHDETAASVFGPAFTGLQRRLAKNLNFGFPYGIGPQKFATYLNAVPSECEHWTWNGFRAGRPMRCDECDVCTAAGILDGYRRTYPRLVATMDGLARIAEREGVLGMGWPGRRRHFRGAGYSVPGYTALNAVVQGGIGEFMKDMMIAWDKQAYKAGGARLVLQIHDALVFEIPQGVGMEMVLTWLNTTASDLNPFAMPMFFEEKEWAK